MQKIDGLRIDWEFGEGEVVLPTQFTGQSALFQADVLQDWIGQLETMYAQVMERVYYVGTED